MAQHRAQIVGSSAVLRDVLARADRAARTTTSVFILGETGTGKELFARRLHEKSERAAGPFVAVNCSAIPKDLLESELFGHERGAFTGAAQAKAGAFEQAHGGTLFLDEIGDMALEHQAKLLRATQEGEVCRVGGAAPRQVNVRIVAATHRDLRERVAEGTFREDLYYRLAGYELQLPPLRDRRGDIAAIAKALLLREFPEKRLAPACLALMRRYEWPGNIRELDNILHRAAIDARGCCISETVLRRCLHGCMALGQSSVVDRDAALRQALERGGSLTPAELRAELGVSKTTGRRILDGLVSKGVVSRAGTGRGSRYLVAGRAAGTDLSSRALLAIDLAKERGPISRRDFEAAAGVSSRTAKRELAELAGRGALVKVGTGKNAAYRLAAE